MLLAGTFTGAEPSPKSNVYVNVSPASGSLEPEPSKFTTSGGAPDVGFAVSAAVGAPLIAYCVPPRATSDLARSFLSAGLSSPVVNAPPRNPARIDPGPIGVCPAASVAFSLLSDTLTVIVPAAESNDPLSAAP